MAEENEGIAYLRALKQSGSSSSDFSSDVSTAAQTDDRFQGVEKRRSFRHKCEGSAEIREEGCEVRSWASFTDISLHGCYVEAQATYPAGTILHMKLEANGIRIETGGDVRVNYPYLGMGIAFVEMSEENQARLRQLLATISRPRVIMGPGIASTLAAPCPLGSVPLLTDPTAAVQALITFFEGRQMLMREDFLRLLQQSQKK